MNKSRILFFGKLKTLCLSEPVEVEVHPDMTPQDLRLKVSEVLLQRTKHFSGVQDLQSSALANESRILREGEAIGESREFSFLPPVCGG